MVRLKDLLTEGVLDQGILKAVFLAGGPGSGKSFRARHNCDNPGPRWKARYWSCKKW